MLTEGRNVATIRIEISIPRDSTRSAKLQLLLLFYLYPLCFHTSVVQQCYALTMKHFLYSVLFQPRPQSTHIYVRHDSIEGEEEGEE
jgi:hypothetical protein